MKFKLKIYKFCIIYLLLFLINNLYATTIIGICRPISDKSFTPINWCISRDASTIVYASYKGKIWVDRSPSLRSGYVLDGGIWLDQIIKDRFKSDTANFPETNNLGLITLKNNNDGHSLIINFNSNDNKWKVSFPSENQAAMYKCIPKPPIKSDSDICEEYLDQLSGG